MNKEIQYYKIFSNKIIQWVKIITVIDKVVARFAQTPFRISTEEAAITPNRVKVQGGSNMTGTDFSFKP
jgi:hypothetical protein